MHFLHLNIPLLVKLRYHKLLYLFVLIAIALKTCDSVYSTGHQNFICARLMIIVRRLHPHRSGHHQIK